MTTITLPRATVEQALEALIKGCNINATECHQAIYALRAALAQQAEPVHLTGLSIRAQSTIGRWLNEDMDRAVANGANSISMPDELVEIAAWLHAQAEPGRDQRCRAEPRSDGDFVCDCKIGECPGRSAEPAQQAKAETCTWQQDGDSESSVYATSCRRYFSLYDGTPEDNKMAWCCFCGKKLVQEMITEGDDE